MTKKRSQLLITAGIALLLLAGGLKAYDLIQDYRAGRNAQLLLEQVQESIAKDVGGGTGKPAAPDGSDKQAEMLSQMNLPYGVLGILKIPKLELELPVLSECTDGLLNVSVCRYMGEAEDRPERLIVAGHSYKSHFGNLPKLAAGDEVCFTSLTGIEYKYSVTGTEVIAGDGHSALEAGEWDITLFTCNFDGSKRVCVRLQAID